MKKVLLTILAAIMCIGFAACTPTSVDKAKTKMNKAGYTVSAYEVDEDKAEGLVGSFYAAQGGIAGMGGDNLTAMLFATKEDAAEYYSIVDGLGFVLEGKWVYKGTEAAVEAFTAMF